MSKFWYLLESVGIIIPVNVIYIEINKLFSEIKGEEGMGKNDFYLYLTTSGK